MLEGMARIARQSSNQWSGYRLNPSETKPPEGNPDGVRTGIVPSNTGSEPEPTVWISPEPLFERE